MKYFIVILFLFGCYETNKTVRKYSIHEKCLKYHTQPTTHLMMVGRVLYPITTLTEVCDSSIFDTIYYK